MLIARGRGRECVLPATARFSSKQRSAALQAELSRARGGALLEVFCAAEATDVIHAATVLHRLVADPSVATDPRVARVLEREMGSWRASAVALCERRENRWISWA